MNIFLSVHTISFKNFLIHRYSNLTRTRGTKYQGDFNKIIEYGEMKSLNISKEEMKYFIDIMKQLGNRPECAQFFTELQEDISYENVIKRILTKQELDIQFEEEISFISNNFDSFVRVHPKILC